MSARPNLPFPRDPAYGNRVLRRRIRLENHDGRVEARLADEFHEMHCTLHHDGSAITDIVPRTLRIPTTGCPGAGVVLRELIGMPLSTPHAILYDSERMRRHCTHMFDLAVLAMAQAARSGEGGRLYDAEVPDETGQPVMAMISRDGVPVHRWRIRDFHIVEPAPLAGRPLVRGFGRWAKERFDGDELEAATILSRTCLIAIGAPYLTEAFTGLTLRAHQEQAGVCHAYRRETLDNTWFIAGARRDSTHGVTEQRGGFSSPTNDSDVD